MKPVEEFLRDHDLIVRELFDQVMALQRSEYERTGEHVLLTNEQIDELTRKKLREWEAR
jgi:hypothetical protein